MSQPDRKYYVVTVDKPQEGTDTQKATTVKLKDLHKFVGGDEFFVNVNCEEAELVPTVQETWRKLVADLPPRSYQVYNFKAPLDVPTNTLFKGWLQQFSDLRIATSTRSAFSMLRGMIQDVATSVPETATVTVDIRCGDVHKVESWSAQELRPPKKAKKTDKK